MTAPNIQEDSLVPDEAAFQAWKRGNQRTATAPPPVPDEQDFERWKAGRRLSLDTGDIVFPPSVRDTTDLTAPRAAPTVKMKPVVVSKPATPSTAADYLKGFGLERGGASLVELPKASEPVVTQSPARQRLEKLKAPMVAASDVTETRNVGAGLGSHLPGQGASLPGALVENAAEMVRHPLNTAKALAMTAPEAGAAWSDVAKGTGTVKEAAIKTAQAIALGATGPAEGLLEPYVGSVVGKAAAPFITRTAVNAAAGATFSPDRPAIGAILGGVMGAASGDNAARVADAIRARATKAQNVLDAIRAQKGRAEQPPALPTIPAVEQRAEPRPVIAESTPAQLAAYRQRLISEQQRLAAYADSDNNPEHIAAYNARHARLGKEIAAIDAASPQPSRSAFAADNTPGRVNIQRVPVRDINLDPSRFQYKRGADTDTGAGSELKGLSKFDEQLAGVVSVWRDPQDGKLYAVNGHNRIALAQRTGHESVNAQILPAKTAEEAKSMGALANIAEGRGTALDAATFFRNSGLGINDLANRVSFKGAIARQGMGLSKLAPDVFSKVEVGQLPESSGAVIGDELVSPEMQRAAVQAIEASGKRLSDGEVRDVARQVAQAGSEQVKQSSLFGTEQIEHPLYVEKAQLASLIKARLSGDRRLFGYVSKEGRAAGLARAGNVIDVEGSKRIAQESSQLEEVFNQLYTRSGPIADALTAAARRVANGEKPRGLIEGLYPTIKQAVQEALGRGEGAGNPTPGVGGEVGQSEAGPDAAGRQVAGTETGQADEGHALDSTDPNQAGLLSPEDFHPGELREPRAVVPDDAAFQAWKAREGHPLLSPGDRQAVAGPERLATFAVKTEDGTIIEGRSAVDAMLRAARGGYDTSARHDGFITSHGRFVPAGREAMMLAFRADQLRRNTSLYKSLSQGAIPLEVSRRGNESSLRGVGGKNAMVGPAPEPLIAARITESGVERGPDTNPYHEVYLREQEREAGLPPDRNNPKGAPVIASRAVKYGKGEGAQVMSVEDFRQGYHHQETGKSVPVIEGYKLSDGSFITREEAKTRFPGADFGPEGRDESGALFNPEDEAQRSMFQGREGTAASRNLNETERHAAGELTKLKQAFALETDPKSRQSIAARIAEYSKLLNRGKGISADEMRIRAIAAEEASGIPPEGPDQGVLLSPATQQTPLGAWYRRVMGVKNPAFPSSDVVALRKISLSLADAVGVPLREGRGNLKRIKALGAFYTKPEVIRVRKLKAVDTAAHEVGHYLSKKYDLKFYAKIMPAPDRMIVGRELVKMGHDLYGSRRPAGGYGEEGIAQWTRFYVTDPTRMVNDAPTFTTYMDKLLEREPALRDALLKARNDWETYQASPSDEKIASMIERTAPSRFAGMTPGRLIDYLFNDLKAIRRAEEKIGTPIKMSESAANLAELTKGNAGRTKDILSHGWIKFNSEGVRTTRGLQEILQEIGEKNRDEFTNYLVARQVLTKTGQGIDTGFDVPAAQEVTEKAAREHPESAKLAQDTWDFRSAGLEYQRDAGLMTDAEVQGIRKNNPTPTPFYRSFGEDEAGAGGGGRSVKFARNSAGIFKMVGSDRPIIDPLQSIIHDAYTSVDRAQKHYAVSVIIKAALSLDGGGHIAQLLPEVPKELRRIDLSRVTDQLSDAGWTPPADSEAAFALKYLEAFYEKRQAGAREIRDQVLPIILDGKRQWVQINDKSLWQALEGMSVPELGVLERMVAAPTRWLRLGATAANPDFALINPLRDAFPAAIYSAGPTHLPGYHVIVGAKHLFKEAFGLHGGDPVTERFAQEGGESAGMVGADIRTMTRDYQRNVHEMMRTMPVSILDHFKHPIKSIAEQFQYFETSTRLGEMIIVREARMKAGMPEREASVEGAYSGRNVTQDFQKQGRTIRWLNRYIPFLGAQMGDIYKLSQEFNPQNLATREGRARYASVGLRAMAYITVPSVYLYLMQHDDPDYQEIPEYVKSNAWVIIDKEHGPIPFRLRSGKEVHVWLMPRPYMLGYIFGYLPEKILAGVKDHDPHAFADMVKSAANIFIPPWIPTIAGPIIENYANRSTYSGRSIVPQTTQGLEPGEQSQPYTGETARALGHAIGYSPAKIENTVRGYTGGLGTTALRGSDAIVRKVMEIKGMTPLKPPSPTAQDPLDRLPVIGRFVGTPPGANSKTVSQLFQDFQDAEEKRQTWHSYITAGNQDKAKQYLADNRQAIMSVATADDAGSDGELRVIHKALGDITAARRAIANQPLSPDEKAGRIQDLEERMIRIARGYYKYSTAAAR